MHELSITQNILDTALLIAKNQNASKVVAVEVEVGPFSGIIEQCVQIYWELLSKDTIAQDAAINVVETGIAVECQNCGWTGVVTANKIECRECGSSNIKRMESGAKVEVTKVAVE